MQQLTFGVRVLVPPLQPLVPAQSTQPSAPRVGPLLEGLFPRPHGHVRTRALRVTVLGSAQVWEASRHPLESPSMTLSGTCR